MRLQPLALAVILSLVPNVACHVVIADSDCSHTAPREAKIDATGATRLVFEAGAGSLEVHGTPGLTEVRAHGTACASRDSMLDSIQIETERRGDTVYVTTRIPEVHYGSAALDLSIEVPAQLAVEGRDGSGESTIRSVASLDFHDGSGTIEISDVAGQVRIEDGSGALRVLGVGGDLEIEDGSGAIEVKGVSGTVRLSDGSGEMTVSDVGRDVVVDEDGSGGMEITGVGGNVLVRRDGSGGIRVRDVQGDFTVARDGSGGIDFDGVHGRVSIPH